jgi:prepilin-type N-terminal cleavage/methylation domain-containing protein
MKISSGGHPRQNSAFTFIEMIIVVTILGLFVAIAVPNYMRARDTARLNMILHNLRKIEVAKTQYALDTKKTNGANVDLNALTNYFRDGKVNDVIHETYVPNPIGTPARAALPNGTTLPPYGPGGDIPAP